MYLVDSKDKEYRFGDHGPKYLMQGPRMSLGLCRLRPGEIYRPHVHRIMEEDFYVLKGQLRVEVDGTCILAEEGQMVHIEPGDFHTCSNPGDEDNEYIIACAPFSKDDKYLTKE